MWARSYSVNIPVDSYFEWMFSVIILSLNTSRKSYNQSEGETDISWKYELKRQSQTYLTLQIEEGCWSNNMLDCRTFIRTIRVSHTLSARWLVRRSNWNILSYRSSLVRRSNQYILDCRRTFLFQNNTWEVFNNTNTKTKESKVQ